MAKAKPDPKTDADLDFLAGVVRKFVSGALEFGISDALKLKDAYSRSGKHPDLFKKCVRRIALEDKTVSEFVAAAAMASPKLRKMAEDAGFLPKEVEAEVVKEAEVVP
jgi:hypothetical protein